MKEWFSYEGPLIRFLQKTGELILVNIAFLVCCVPVVTAGASATSFYYAVIKSIRHERGNPPEEFFRSMKRVLKKGCLASLQLLLGALLLYLGFGWAKAAERTHLEAIYLLLAVVGAGVSLYLFPVLSRFELPLGAAWKLSFVMAVRFFPVTALLLLAAAVTGWLLIFLLPMPCFVIVPGVFVLLSTFPMEHVLLAYMPKENRDETAWYYEKKQRKKERKEVRHESL